MNRYLFIYDDGSLLKSNKIDLFDIEYCNEGILVEIIDTLNMTCYKNGKWVDIDESI